MPQSSKKPTWETKKKSIKQVFPRDHQLDVAESLLADVKANSVGKKHLIQHSAGRGKSDSIAWLAHQLIGLEKDGHPMIDSVIVVTDRRILDKQICDTIKQFMQVANTVVWAEHAADLRKAIADGNVSLLPQLKSPRTLCRKAARNIKKTVLPLSSTRRIPVRVGVILLK